MLLKLCGYNSLQNLMLYYIKCKIKNYLKVVMDNYNSNNGRLMAFYIICLASYVLGGLCLTQFKLTMQSVPQTVYLIIIVGLFFLYGIIFLFMLFQYLCRKDLT
ncbi:MAG TPA: hypothetical protein DEP74_17420, partial [Citrobacter freundii]|nr:hypothetical protein [Citrobacter freundii]